MIKKPFSHLLFVFLLLFAAACSHQSPVQPSGYGDINFHTERRPSEPNPSPAPAAPLPAKPELATPVDPEAPVIAPPQPAAPAAEPAPVEPIVEVGPDAVEPPPAPAGEVIEAIVPEVPVGPQMTVVSSLSANNGEKVEFSYDAEGQLEKLVMSIDDAPSLVDSFAYDQNKMTQTRTYQALNRVETWYWGFDEQGKKTTLKKIFNEEMFEYWTYTYDENSHLATETQFLDPNGAIINLERTFTYDANGLASITEGGLDKKFSYSYQDGCLVKKTNLIDRIAVAEYVCTFDAAGILKKLGTSTLVENIWERLHYEFHYNAEGKLDGYTTLNRNDQTLIKTTIAYIQVPQNDMIYPEIPNTNFTLFRDPLKQLMTGALLFLER